jgi:hypothetical protein
MRSNACGRQSNGRGVAEFDPVPLLSALTRHRVRYVVVGGIAAIAQGHPLPTVDVDVTPARDAENLERLAAAVQELGGELRVGRGGQSLTFPIEPRFLGDVDSWTLTTRYGPLDLLFAPTGTAGYEDLRRAAHEAELAPGVNVFVASLPDVIRMKQASARPKDLAQLPALRQTLEVIRRREAGESGAT